ncbi:hypothetical protein O181_082686 [Austropuccinia psidii MF-1]|uniref:Uncharacterized protein n=1 Tax=Austropuccinia psidii MF-1 TaxID=1389203 RepID=A0A9Q3FMK5_9BASI|nr:hypothetical protein [Austropuccinia psidii MF-1]
MGKKPPIGAYGNSSLKKLASVGVKWLLDHTQLPWPILHLTRTQAIHPFNQRGFGVNRLFGPFRHPMASMACMLWSIGHRMWDNLGPPWPKSNEAKRGKGARHLAPNTRWVPPGPILVNRSQRTKMAITGHEPSRCKLWPVAATSNLQKDFPSRKGKPFPVLCPGMRNIWLYTIMHHFSSEIQW